MIEIPHYNHYGVSLCSKLSVMSSIRYEGWKISATRLLIMSCWSGCTCMDMWNHLQIVLDISVPHFPHMTGLHFTVSYQMLPINHSLQKWREHIQIKFSEMQCPHQYREWKAEVPHKQHNLPLQQDAMEYHHPGGVNTLVQSTFY